MGFVIRALFVIGVLYLLSPLRASLPDWLAKPSAGPVQLAVVPALANTYASTAAPISAGVETLGKAALAACKGHEKACMEAAASALKTVDTKTVDTRAIDSGDAIAALLKDIPAPEKPHTVTVADAVTDAQAIPLPPRRELPPAPAAVPALPTQKKI